MPQSKREENTGMNITTTQVREIRQELVKLKPAKTTLDGIAVDRERSLPRPAPTLERMKKRDFDMQELSEKLHKKGKEQKKDTPLPPEKTASASQSVRPVTISSGGFVITPDMPDDELEHGILPLSPTDSKTAFGIARAVLRFKHFVIRRVGCLWMKQVTSRKQVIGWHSFKNPNLPTDFSDSPNGEGIPIAYLLPLTEYSRYGLITVFRIKNRRTCA